MPREISIDGVRYNLDPISSDICEPSTILSFMTLHDAVGKQRVFIELDSLPYDPTFRHKLSVGQKVRIITVEE